VKDFTIDTLVIEEDREAHIAKHTITTEEVLEVLTSDYVYIAGREARWLLIGKTGDQRFLQLSSGSARRKQPSGLSLRDHHARAREVFMLNL
jgi:hypothetical protein